MFKSRSFRDIDGEVIFGERNDKDERNTEQGIVNFGRNDFKDFSFGDYGGKSNEKEQDDIFEENVEKAKEEMERFAKVKVLQNEREMIKEALQEAEIALLREKTERVRNEEIIREALVLKEERLRVLERKKRKLKKVGEN